MQLEKLIALILVQETFNDNHKRIHMNNAHAGVIEVDSIFKWNGTKYERGLADYSIITNKRKVSN
jgi:hypothetical protein